MSKNTITHLLDKLDRDLAKYKSYKDMLCSLGIEYTTTNWRLLKEYILKEGLSTQHIHTYYNKLNLIPDDIFIKAVESSKSLGDIAKNLNLESHYYSCIKKRIKKLNIVFEHYKHSKWSDDETKKLIENYSTHSVQELLRIFPHRTEKTIRTRAKILHLSRERVWESSSNLKILLDESLCTYYWIGFIFADATVTPEAGVIRIVQSASDLDHLKQFSEYVSSVTPIRMITPRRETYGNGPMSALDVYNKNIVIDIANKFNFKNKKTYNPPSIDVFKAMSDDHFIAMLIGFIDGDGCVYKIIDSNNVSIKIGCHKNWFFVFEYWAKRVSEIYNAITPRPLINKSEISIFRMNKREICCNLKKFAILHNLPVLNRKWDKINLNSEIRSYNKVYE